MLGINHCLAHILGATFHIPHGRANAQVMIPVIRFNAALPKKFTSYPAYRFPNAKMRYAEIAEAMKKIYADYDAEETRGASPRYWEDVKEGDWLTPVVKGPLSRRDIYAWTWGREVPL